MIHLQLKVHRLVAWESAESFYSLTEKKHMNYAFRYVHKQETQQKKQPLERMK
jgi:hypothetical protein